MKIAVAFILEVAIIAGIITLIGQIHSIPYNVRELLGRNHPVVQIVVFLLTFNLIFCFPVLLGYGISRCRAWKSSAFFPIAVMSCGSLVFLLLYFAVPMESIHDVVGSPVLGWPWAWEQAYRFLFLCAPFLCLWAGGAILVKMTVAGTGDEKQGLMYWAGNTAILIILSYVIVVEFAATDNLVELLENRGGWTAGMSLGLWILLIGIIPSLFCAGSVFKRFPGVYALLAALASVPLGYCLIDLALVNDLQKYGKHFSGLQFLLSSDRSHYASGMNLAVRYALVHFGLNVMMAIGQRPFWEYWRIREKPHTRKGLHWGGFD